MKKITVLCLPLLLLCAAIAVLGLSSLGHEGFSFWQWVVVAVAVLLSAILVGALLNLAVFAPAYWLLGRLHLRRSEKGTNREHKTNKDSIDRSARAGGVGMRVKRRRARSGQCYLGLNEPVERALSFAFEALGKSG
jgi:hypothetical protein